MNKDFSRIITMLRKERKLSQKQAAVDLNISQALLSHYEKGIRECGLEFVVRIADYYNVACDYLLGRTPERTGATLTVEDIPEFDDLDNTAITNGNLINTLNKKLIINSTNVLFEILESTANKGMTNYISNYLMVSVYKMFRIIYAANPQNPNGLFSVAPHLYMGFSSAHQNIAETKALSLALGNSDGKFEGIAKDTAPRLSPEIIAEQFPIYASSLLNLIQTTEGNLEENNS
ncbi:hypothetical protein AGMMS50284_5290 [Clostridia bacterium]|nr:hypothetical protein AGMMS50284_5290 [Clostridia bacterium]